MVSLYIGEAAAVLVGLSLILACVSGICEVCGWFRWRTVELLMDLARIGLCLAGIFGIVAVGLQALFGV